MRKDRILYGKLLLMAMLLGGLLNCQSGEEINAVPSGTDLSQMEKDVLAKINGHRRAIGLPELRRYEPASEVARKHSEDLAAKRVSFGHVGFGERIDKLRAEIAISGAAENEGYVENFADPVAAVVNAWLASEGHRKNIEGNFDLAGTGVAKCGSEAFYFTVIFLRVAPGATPH